MKYVVTEHEESGVRIDVQPYLGQLPTLMSQLPPGARSFLAEPGHFSFGDRCLHDMVVVPVLSDNLLSFGWTNGADDVLTITYQDLSRIEITNQDPDGTGGDTHPWEVIFDEILPAKTGCTHEIVCFEGTVFIEFADLHATWLSQGE